MRLTPFTHVGILVEDLDEAIKTFSARAEVDFTPAMVTALDNFTEGESTRPVSVRCVYSRGGPPYYELIQAQDDGIFGRQNGLGVHHVGMWASDCNAKLDELTAVGVEVEGAQRTPDGKIVIAFLKPSSLVGMRLEIIDDANRAGFEAWIGS